ncbi:hypothetical protein KAR91_33155 [Candidatus Pacearchaeota archaeon]|nr:hypothetical protein [Candidatus Pacearchaeota archaeon]
MRTSLDRSITKWRKIVASTEAKDLGGVNCALCQEFGNNSNCNYCPVKVKTKRPVCHDTPWEKWSTHQVNSHNRQDGVYFREPYCRKCLQLAKDELNFLIGVKND